MQKNSTLIENVSSEQFMELMVFMFRKELESFKKELQTQSANDDLLSREQVLELLQINATSLWRWTNQGKIIAYKFANKCYYKRSEIMATITPLKK